jgi:hypothetical protein
MPYRPDPDEGPSPADQRRFGDDAVRTGLCPDCGAEVLDDADICPRCFMFLDGETLQRPARARRGFFHKRWITLLILLLIVSMVGGAVAFILARL